MAQNLQLDSLPLERARLQQQVVSLVSSSPLVRQGDVDGMARLVTEQVAQLLGVERVGVWLFNEAKDALICRDIFFLSESRHDSGAVLRQAAFAEEFAYLLTERFVDAHDPYSDPRTRGYAEGYLRPNRITSMLDAVVRLGEELIGAICFEHVDRPHRWEDDEITFASQLGDQLALTVSIARQRAVAEQLAERERELREVNELLEARVEERTRSLENAKLALLQAERLAAMGRMVAGVAHELNTPIGNALLMASTLHAEARHVAGALAEGALGRRLLSDFLDGAVAQSTLIEHALHRAAALVETFKRLSLDQASQARRQFDLRQVVEQTFQALGPRLRRAGVQVVLEIPPGLIVEGYPGPMEQVVENLAMNALIHAFEGRESGVIRVTGEVRARQVLMTFTDDGLGMPPEIALKIFDPFFTTRLGQGGSGIGLAAVHNIITKLFGGTIGVTSSPGNGACFQLQFPDCAPVVDVEPLALQVAGGD